MNHRIQQVWRRWARPHCTGSRRARLGFTLLELVLVMVIIVIALSVVVPRLTGFSRGRKLHDAADEFVSMTRFARTQAITNGAMYRITIDVQHGSYQLTRQDGTDFVVMQNDMGHVMQIPGGMQIQMKQAKQQQQSQASNSMTSGQASPPPTPQDSIDFFPSGRTQPAQIVFTASDGDTLIVECPSAAEDFAVSTKTNP